MPFDPHLADLMRDALKARPGIQEKKMLGGYCWMLRGNMLCGVEVGRYMFRVGKELEAQALARPGARPMDITGKADDRLCVGRSGFSPGGRSDRLDRVRRTVCRRATVQIADMAVRRCMSVIVPGCTSQCCGGSIQPTLTPADT